MNESTKETDALCSPSRAFLNKWHKSFCHDLFIEALFSAYPSYKLMRGFIWLKFHIGGHVCIWAQYKMPPQQYCLLPGDTSGLQQNILVYLQVRDLETTCSKFCVLILILFLRKTGST